MGERRDEWNLDAVCSVLGNPDRRRLLRELAATDGAVTVAELAENVAAAADESVHPDRTLIGLRHVHLPALSDGNVVEYDPESGVVRPTEHLEYLCRLADDFDQTHRKRV